jgi:RNA polymerase sigma factor (TIGR02999 family)
MGPSSVECMADEKDITVLLGKAREGDSAAGARAFALLYQEMRRLARAHLSRERAQHTLEPTALVNEVFLRIAGRNALSFESRSHFLAFISQVMRRLLVDYARVRNATKRSHAGEELDLEKALVIDNNNWGRLLVLNDALDRLATWDARQAQIVEMRFFGGLTEEETAAALRISVRTVRRDWEHARAWLHGELGEPR